MSTRCLRSLTRVLLAAMLLAVLAPAASRALSRTRVAGDWVEICTAQGMRWVQWTAQGIPAEPDPTKAWHALDLCGHCTLQADRFAPLLPSPLPVPVGAGVWAVPMDRATPLRAWAAPSPGARDPPLLN